MSVDNYPFCFKNNKYNYLEIYESIKKYYPIGISKDCSDVFLSFSGQKKLEDIVVENLHDENNFNERWVNFDEEIAKETGKEIVGTAYGQAPSFSSYLILDKTKVENLTRTKELHFFVSLIGNYYTIIGSDENAVNRERRMYRTTNYLVASPVEEYAESFEYLIEKIEKRFPKYKFIPFNICRSVMEGLQVRYSDEKLNSIFNALFNNYIDLNINRIVGDEYFKSEDWIKEGYVDDGDSWTIYPPMS